MSLESWNNHNDASPASASSSSSAAPTRERSESAAAVKRKNCSACRYRRIKCVRDDGMDNCNQCLKKGIACLDMPVVEGKRTRNRTGKRIEDAMLFFGKNATSAKQQSSKQSAPPPPTPPEPPSSLIPTSIASRFHASRLQQDIAASIIDEYLDFVVPKSVVSGTDFRTCFNKVERRIDALDDEMRVLAAVVLSVAARYSAHPIFVGNGAPTAQHLADVGFIGTDLSAFGPRREVACETLLEQAIEMLDAKGTMRQPSIPGLASLFLFEGLLQGRDFSDTSATPYSQTYICHAKLLSEDTAPPLVKTKVIHGVLGWSAFIRDAVISANAGTSPLYSEDDISNLQDVDVPIIAGLNAPRPLASVLEHGLKIPSLAFWEVVIAYVNHVALMGRDVATRLTGSRARKAVRVDTNFMDDFLHNIALCKRARIAATLLGKTIPTETLTSHDPDTPVNCNHLIHSHLMCQASLTILVHVTMEKRTEADGSGYSTVLFGTGATMNWIATTDEISYNARVAQWRKEVKELLFESTQDLVLIIKETLEEFGPIGMAQLLDGIDTQLFFTRLPIWLPVMLDQPVMEEGGLRSEWTYATKIVALTWILNGVRAISWAYERFGQHTSWLESEIQLATIRRQMFYDALDVNVNPPATPAPPPKSNVNHGNDLSLLSPMHLMPTDLFFEDYGVSGSSEWGI